MEFGIGKWELGICGSEREETPPFVPPRRRGKRKRNVEKCFENKYCKKCRKENSINEGVEIQSIR
jgi:hypothetical protein